MFASSALVATPRGPLFVRRTGEADVEPVLFVHGLGGESLDWADVVELLAGHVDAYALDLPGFGESPPASDRDFSIDGHARAVVAAIHAIGRGRVHLVGNSLGGAVATRVAAEHPELVRSLALLSPALPDLRPRWPAWELLLTLLPLIGPRLVADALRGDPERTARQVFATCYGYPAAVTGERWTAELEAIGRRAGLPHGSQAYRGSLRSLVAAYLHGGRIGVLVETKGGSTDFARGVAMHVAAMNPPYNKAGDVPAAFIEKEKEIELAKMSDKDKAKPANILEKIIGGKIAKIVNENTLYGQPYVLNTEQTVEAAAKAAGADVLGFKRLVVGEGIEKVQEDYVAEVKKAMGG